MIDLVAAVVGSVDPFLVLHNAGDCLLAAQRDDIVTLGVAGCLGSQAETHVLGLTLVCDDHDVVITLAYRTGCKPDGIIGKLDGDYPAASTPLGGVV